MIGYLQSCLPRAVAERPQSTGRFIDSPSLERRWLHAASVLVLAAGVGAPTAAWAQCEITYTRAWEGGNGFGAEIVINNLGPAINGWSLEFAFPGNQRITNGWPVSFSQPGGSAQVTISSNAAWNESIATNGSFSVGFNANANGANVDPTAFTLNGVSCNGGSPGNQPPVVNLTSPSEGATFPTGSAVTLRAAASDPDGAVTSVEFRVDGALVATDTEAPYVFTVSGLAAGAHTAQATAFDNGSPALSAVTPNVSFTIEGTPGGSDAVFRVNENGRITKDGVVFPVRCGSWFGLEGRHEPSSDPVNPSGAPLELYIGNTFYANGGAGTGRTIQDTMTEIVNMGINVIRLPVVPQTLDPNDPQASGDVLKNHPSVRSTNAREALEEFIVIADQNNVEVMLDIHACSNYTGWRAGRLDARPPYVDADREDYDFPREDSSCSATGNPPGVTNIQPYDESQWLDNLRELAGMGQSLGVDNIIGIDIYNEPWDYSWAEWKALSEAAYNAINEVNPNTLIFVQGISASSGNQDGTPETKIDTPHGDLATNPNWGENLFEAAIDPPAIPKNRLVYSPHTYGPSVFVQKMFMDPNQPGCEGLEGDEAGDQNCNIVIDPPLLRAGWEEHFGYLRDQGYAIVVGEFGGNLDWPLGQASLRDRERWSHITPGIDGEWQDVFIDYMIERGMEGCYWSINPESGDTAGWYGHAYDPVSNTAGCGECRDFDARKTTLLNRLWGTSSP